MKIKIIQYTVGNNQEYNKLFSITKKINSKYCQLHNYQYYDENISENQIINLYGEIDSEIICVYKLNFIYNQLMKNDADVLVIIDADAAVNNPNIKIEDLIDNQHELFLSRGHSKECMITCMNKLIQTFSSHLFNKEQLYKKHMNTYFKYSDRADAYQVFCSNMIHNEGLYIIKNTDTMKEFYKEAVNYIYLFLYGEYTDYPAPESQILFFLLRKKIFKNIYTYLYDQAQCSFFTKYEGIYDEDKTFILHNYGPFSLKQKIEWFMILQNNKWWKPFSLFD